MKCKKEFIEKIIEKYSFSLDIINDIIDTSHKEEDLRLNVIINDAYVLKINTIDMISESFLQGINILVKKYKSIDVWCPTILQNKEGELLTLITYDGKKYYCYVEEKSPYLFYKENDMYTFKKEMLPHVGKMAHLYSNQDLVSHYSMWSILDVGSMCTEIDEKQENLNDLIKVLSVKGYNKLAYVLQEKNEIVRMILQKKYKELPRCVYQGDLNPSNILVDSNNKFIGIIDFNMYGSEVNINCFINESMYYMQKEDFTLPAKAIYEKAESTIEELLECILKEYTLNDMEKELFPYYKFITSISFYPNVQLWITLLEENEHVSKVLELLNMYLLNVTV